MSSADRNDLIPFTVNDANAIITFPLVDHFMRRPFNIDLKGYDIPYLAGYSKDGSVIYIDRDIGEWRFHTKAWPTSPFLVLHERVEKAIIDALAAAQDRDLERLLILLRMTARDDQVYFHTHGVATAAEDYAVKMQVGIDGRDSYNAFMGTQVKRAEDERIRRVPAALDMTPYQGHDREDVKLRSVMEARMQ